MYAKYAELRDAKGLTDYKVAKMTGIYRSTFSDWKRGICSPKAEKLIKIAKVIDVPVEVLIKKAGDTDAENK